MPRKIVEARAVVALAMSGGVGLWGLRAYPVSHDDVFLGLIGERAPGMLSVLTYGHATLRAPAPGRSRRTRSPSSDLLRRSFLARGITRRLLDRRRVPSG